MRIDFHTHVLSGIDDGARDLPTAIDMLTMLYKQGVELVAATPHFYAHQQPLTAFLQQRETAVSELAKALSPDMPQAVIGAEVYIERGLREMDLRPLCLAGTDLLLVELPYTSYQNWFLEEIYHICLKQSMTPIFAHLDRYLALYPLEAINEILDYDDALFQINHRALFSMGTRRKVLQWIGQGYPILWGSDSHNTLSRSPRTPRARHILQSRLGHLGWRNTTVFPAS